MNIHPSISALAIGHMVVHFMCESLARMITRPHPVLTTLNKSYHRPKIVRSGKMFGIITPGLTLLLKVAGAFKKIFGRASSTVCLDD